MDAACGRASMHRARTTQRPSSRMEAGNGVVSMLKASRRLRHALRDSSCDKLMLFDHRNRAIRAVERSECIDCRVMID